jgi:hypothetical protein
LKKPIYSDSSESSAGSSKSGLVKIGNVSPGADSKVLGTSTGPILNSDSKSNKQFDSVFNICMDFLALLVRNWKWTLAGIVAMFLLFKITGGRKR